MALTYEPIATTTISSPISSYTFSSIPSTYTDLRIVLTGGTTGTFTTTSIWLRINGDTGTNYSRTLLRGDGSTIISQQSTNASSLQSGVTTVASLPGLWTFDIFSYTASINKTILVSESLDGNGTGNVINMVGLWRNTASITSLTLISNTNLTFGTATLYGIKAA